MWVQAHQFLTQAERLPPETEISVGDGVCVWQPHPSHSLGTFLTAWRDHGSAREVEKEETPRQSWLAQVL